MNTRYVLAALAGMLTIAIAGAAVGTVLGRTRTHTAPAR
jgi:hypothetical protein